MSSKKQRSKRKNQNHRTNLNFSHQNQLAQPIKIPSVHRDDLLDIDGIQPTLELALNSIGILTYSDFDGYTPESLSQALQKGAGISVSESVIDEQRWLEQAKELTQKSHSANHFIREIKEDQITSEAWNQKSRVKPVADSSPSVEEPKLIDTKQINQSLTEDEKKLKDFKQLITLKITEVGFNRIELSATDGTKQNKMRGEISCDLAGDNAEEIIQHKSPICTAIYVVDTKTNEAKLVAAKSFLPQPSQNNYTIHLEFDIPPVGYYRLNTVVFILAPESAIDYHPGPFLRVISA